MTTTTTPTTTTNKKHQPHTTNNKQLIHDDDSDNNNFLSVCPFRAAPVSAAIGEAFLDLEARDHTGLKRFLDVTVRHEIPRGSLNSSAAAKGTAPVLYEFAYEITIYGRSS